MLRHIASVEGLVDAIFLLLFAGLVVVTLGCIQLIGSVHSHLLDGPDLAPSSVRSHHSRPLEIRR